MRIFSALRRRPTERTEAVELPAGARSFRMLWVDDHDQTLQAVRAGGWTAFEKPLPELLFHLLRRRPGLMIDAGANTGFYGLLAVAAHPRSRVIAFEPDPKVHPILAGNVQVNGFGRRMRVSPSALSDRVGSAPLYVPWDDHGVVETSSSLEADFKPRHQDIIAVPVTTIDQVAADGPPPVLIKVDVEGHELSVLAGAGSVLANHRPIVLVELLERTDWRAVNALTQRHGYQGFTLAPSGPRRTLTLAFDPKSWNQVLCPAELSPLLIGVLEAVYGGPVQRQP